MENKRPKDTVQRAVQCDYIENCGIGEIFRTNSKKFWIQHYCHGPKMSQCARLGYKKRASKIMPANLLHNGSYIDG